MTEREIKKIKQKVSMLIWYHTIDLGHGIVTPGIYDHRRYLEFYGIPDDLSGKSALDIGTASGFFSFEMEKKGAKVTATDLANWMDHDFGALYKPDRPLDVLQGYLQKPFELAKEVLNSGVKKKKINIYDVSPDTLGTFDLVFCSSLLLHLTDPIRALQNIRSVTREMAIIATGIRRDENKEPLASFSGHKEGAVWWLPNRPCLESMIQSTGFKRWEWFSEFRLDYSDGRAGTHHGVIHAYNKKT